MKYQNLQSKSITWESILTNLNSIYFSMNNMCIYIYIHVISHVTTL